MEWGQQVDPHGGQPDKRPVMLACCEGPATWCTVLVNKFAYLRLVR